MVLCIGALNYSIQCGHIRTGVERLKPACLKSFGAGGTLWDLKSTSRALFQIKQREDVNGICDPECVLPPHSRDHCLVCSVQGRESSRTLLMLESEPRYLGEHLICGREHWEAQCCHESEPLI